MPEPNGIWQIKVSRLFSEQNLTAAILSRKVSELVSSRGRKGTDAKFILRSSIPACDSIWREGRNSNSNSCYHSPI